MNQNDSTKLGILLLDGSINKTKINYIAGEMTQPFAEMVTKLTAVTNPLTVRQISRYSIKCLTGTIH
jgi:hypothetical protein